MSRKSKRNNRSTQRAAEGGNAAERIWLNGSVRVGRTAKCQVVPNGDSARYQGSMYVLYMNRAVVFNGNLGGTAEVMYAFVPEYWGKGIFLLLFSMSLHRARGFLCK